MKSYYDILEIPSDASAEKIRSQYLLMINAWHPDKFRNPDQKKFAEEKTKEINEAYEVLKDSGKRAAYDRKLRHEEEENSEFKNSQSTSASHTESTATPKYERKKEEPTSKQESSTFDSPADDYVVCWNCSATNRNNETYCQKCGVALDEKFKQPHSIFFVLKIFSFLVVIFLIIILFNSIFDNPSSKANNSPVSVVSSPFPTKVPTQLPTKVPTKNPNILFSDDFSVRKSSSEFSDEYFDMWYGDDESYYIKTKRPNYYSWLTIPIKASDVIIKTYIQQIDAPSDGYYGIVCRASSNGHYFFHVYKNGYFNVGKIVDGVNTSIKSGTESNAVTGSSITTVVGECIGSNLRLKINGKLLAEVLDNSLTSGDAGLVAGAGNNGENTVKFLDVLVTKPISSGLEQTKTAELRSTVPSNCIDWDEVNKENVDAKDFCVYGDIRDGGKIGIKFFVGYLRCGTPSYKSNHSDECNTYMENQVSYDTYYFQSSSHWYHGRIIFNTSDKSFEEKLRIDSHLKSDDCIWITGKLFDEMNWFENPHKVNDSVSSVFVISEIINIGYCSSTP